FLVGRIGHASPEAYAAAKEAILRDKTQMREIHKTFIQLKESRHHKVALLESEAGFPIDPSIDPRQFDVPSQKKIATYFWLTGHAPDRNWTSAALERKLRAIERARHNGIPLDRENIRLHVLQLMAELHAPHAHWLFTPLRREVARPHSVFPWAGGHLLPDDARELYRQALAADGPAVHDTFIGHDGWHYVRMDGGDGTQAIVAAQNAVG